MSISVETLALAKKYTDESGGGGGGGTSNYNQLSNRPQINGVVLTGNRSAADLSLGTYSKPSGGIPASDLASGVIPSVASDVGAIAAPANPSDGQILCYNSTLSEWTARNVPIESSVISEEYSSSKAYAQGLDYCMKDGILYLCIATTPSVGETWNPSHWHEIKVTEIVNGIINMVTAFGENINNKIALPENPSNGQFLVYNGTNWVAQTVPAANGVSF